LNTELLDILSKNIFLALAAELRRQRHRLTGALEKSFEAEIKQTTDKTIINFFMFNYGVYLNDGIPPERIPYKPPPPVRGGKSKYIQGLIRWAKLKFRITDRKAKNAAFAIARKHKKFGYPLTAKGFINIALLKEADEIEKYISLWIEEILNDLINDFIKSLANE
jgi:hypothetical protein